MKSLAKALKEGAALKSRFPSVTALHVHANFIEVLQPDDDTYKWCNKAQHVKLFNQVNGVVETQVSKDVS